MQLLLQFTILVGQLACLRCLPLQNTEALVLGRSLVLHSANLRNEGFSLLSHLGFLPGKALGVGVVRLLELTDMLAFLC